MQATFPDEIAPKRTKYASGRSRRTFSGTQGRAETIQLSLYHSLGKLPEPECTHEISSDQALYSIAFRLASILPCRQMSLESIKALQWPYPPYPRTWWAADSVAIAVNRDLDLGTTIAECKRQGRGPFCPSGPRADDTCYRKFFPQSDGFDRSPLHFRMP